MLDAGTSLMTSVRLFCFFHVDSFYCVVTNASAVNSTKSVVYRTVLAVRPYIFLSFVAFLSTQSDHSFPPIRFYHPLLNIQFNYSFSAVEFDFLFITIQFYHTFLTNSARFHLITGFLTDRPPCDVENGVRSSSSLGWYLTEQFHQSVFCRFDLSV